jgi:hypothetical protein
MRTLVLTICAMFLLLSGCKEKQEEKRKSAAPTSTAIPWTDKEAGLLFRLMLFYQYDEVEALLRKHGSAKIKTKNGDTPLLVLHRGFPMRLLGNQLCRMHELLLKYGVDPNERVPLNVNPSNVPIVLWGNGIDACSLRHFLAAGLNPDISSDHGSRLIFRAVADDDFQALQMLVEAGADPKVIDNSGRSLYFFAHSVDMVKLLKSHGVDPSARDEKGRTAIGSQRAEFEECKEPYCPAEPKALVQALKAAGVPKATVSPATAPSSVSQ